jgi:hypothetical protein
MSSASLGACRSALLAPFILAFDLWPAGEPKGADQEWCQSYGLLHGAKDALEKDKRSA